jgi:hypothetical protein
MRRKPWPVPGSITEEEVNRRIAAAVHSEHAAGSAERLVAVIAAVNAENAACAQIADSQFFGVAKAIRKRKVQLT